MAKPERGLPKNFTIRVPDGPVSLGDYLDEPPPPSPAAVAEAFPQPPVPPVQPSPVPPVPIAAAEQYTTAVVSSPPPQLTRAPTPPRRQFNMSPDTLRMLDDLVIHIRMHSVERDVRASEVVHALVLAAHEVRPYMDLAKVPGRGKWGSPTAAALPVALKNIFQEAILRKQR